MENWFYSATGRASDSRERHEKIKNGKKSSRGGDGEALLRAGQDRPQGRPGSLDLELQLIVAASALLDRYGNVVEVMRSDGFRPAMEVHMVVEGETPLTSTKTVGLGIVEMSNVLHHLRPDVVISVADRYETITTAISGAYMNIPVAHIQGGEVTGSIDEKVRHAVTKLSDLHFVANENAGQRVAKMGEHKGRIHVTGCPSIDLAAWVFANASTPNCRLLSRYTLDEASAKRSIRPTITLSACNILSPMNGPMPQRK